MRNENFDYSNDFKGQKYDGKDFDQCSFIGADLRDATFTNCKMRASNFTGAKMDGITMFNVNLREGIFIGASMKKASLTQCMLIFSQMIDVDGRHSDWTDSDLRGSNFRNANFNDADFTDCYLKGIGMRGTDLVRAKIHRWLADPCHQYDMLPPDTKCWAWKLAQQDGYGIYHPKIKYYEGLEADAEKQEVGRSLAEDGIVPVDTERWDDKTNTGIALAPLEWILREWNMHGANPNWKLFLVSFKAGDFIRGSKGRRKSVAEYHGIKFNVRKITIEKEYDIKQFYDDLKD